MFCGESFGTVRRLLGVEVNSAPGSRQLAGELGVSLDGCLEKSEVVERIRTAQGDPNP